MRHGKARPLTLPSGGMCSWSRHMKLLGKQVHVTGQRRECRMHNEKEKHKSENSKGDEEDEQTTMRPNEEDTVEERKDNEEGKMRFGIILYFPARMPKYCCDVRCEGGWSEKGWW